MSASILERKTWKLESIIHMINKIILDLTITAQEAGPRGRNLHAISTEVRKFSIFLERDVFNSLKFEEKSIEDVQNKMEHLGGTLRLLGINAILESRRLNNHKAFILTDELRKIGESIENILEPLSYKKNLTMQKVDRSFTEPFSYIVVNIAGTYWSQNMNSVIEIVKANQDMLEDYPEGPGKLKHRMKVQGGMIPVVNLHNAIEEELVINENTRIMILNLGHIMYGHTSSDLFFGLLVDDIEYAGYLNKGVHELDFPAEVPAQYIRYLWQTKDVSLLFFNWDNIINGHEIRDYRKIENKPPFPPN